MMQIFTFAICMQVYNNDHFRFQVFDMKIFKSAIDKELHQPYPNRKELLYKTCIRLSLVKEESHPLKTPCWIMIVNLVAMDMLNAKVPFLANSKSKLILLVLQSI